MSVTERADAALKEGQPQGEHSGPRRAQATEAALEALWEKGRTAWPDLPLELPRFASRVRALIEGEHDPAETLAKLRAADFYLACACAEQISQALRAFDASFLVHLPMYLRSLNPTPELVEETRQMLLERVFVGRAGKPPKILQYRGRGALEGWVRVIAVRTGLNLLEATKGAPKAADEADAMVRVIASDIDPELALIKEKYGHELTSAFRDALQGLSRRDRSLLRFCFIEQLTPARIGAIYGVHRTTILRWIQQVQEDVLARTREQLMHRLHLSPSECDSLFAVALSRVGVSILSALQSK